MSLAGNPTRAKGPTRLFTTTSLRKGDKWKDYKIVVSASVNGKKMVKTKTIDLKAGDELDLDFDFTDQTTTLAKRPDARGR